MINGIKSEAAPKAEAPVEIEDDDDDSFYTFNDLEEDSYVANDMSLTNWSLPAEYDPRAFKMPVAPEPAKYDNFVVRAGTLIVKCAKQEQIKLIKAFLLGKTTTSTESVKVYCRFRTQNELIGSYKEAVLAEMDRREELWI